MTMTFVAVSAAPPYTFSLITLRKSARRSDWKVRSCTCGCQPIKSAPQRQSPPRQ